MNAYLLMTLQLTALILTIQIRDPNGKPLAGIPLTIYQQPDHTPAVKYQNTSPTCYTDTAGRCQWEVQPGIYDIETSLPFNQKLAAAAGESGVGGMAVYVTEDTLLGLTLAPNGLLQDRAPEAPEPAYAPPEKTIHDDLDALEERPPMANAPTAVPAKTPAAPTASPDQRRSARTLWAPLIIAAILLAIALFIQRRRRTPRV